MTKLIKITADSPEARSADLVAGNAARLKALFPDAFTEGKIDFDVLKQLLGGAVDEREEKYGLNWHGKRQARQLALTTSLGTLRPCPEESVDWDTTKNLMIEGDNLEVLKLLQKSYAGKVKLIYIDPPYNTGKDFVYPDNFQDTIKNYQELTGQTSEGRKLSSNTEANGRFHTDWLNMMYPRLILAQNLLKDDGVIFISIDDSENVNLTNVCNEIFGSENYISTLIWEKGRKNDARLVSIGHEYILVFAKNKSYFTSNDIKWREIKDGAKEILSEYLRLRAIHGVDNIKAESGIREFYDSLSIKHPSKKHARYNKIDNNGVWRDDNMSWPGGGGPNYDVIHPKTGKKCAVPEGGWRYSTPEKMQKMIDLGKVVFRDDHTEPPIRKTYLIEVDTPTDEEVDDIDPVDETTESDDLPIQVAGTYFYRSALQASNELTEIFGGKVFNNPKDHHVIARWISYVGVDSEEIVLDFFAGSGTTAHSVLQCNLNAQSKIRYFLVQLPELLDHKNKKSKPAIAFLDNLAKPRNISELTKERIRRVGARFRSEKNGIENDVGFRVLRLDSSNIATWNSERNNLAIAIQEGIFNLKENRNDIDILFEILLKFGLDLAVPIASKMIAKKSVHSIGGGSLIVCLADGITSAITNDLGRGILSWIAEQQVAGEVRVVFKDSGFVDDVAKTNMVAILSQGGIDAANIRSI